MCGSTTRSSGATLSCRLPAVSRRLTDGDIQSAIRTGTRRRGLLTTTEAGRAEAGMGAAYQVAAVEVRVAAQAPVAAILLRAILPEPIRQFMWVALNENRRAAGGAGKVRHWS